GISRSAADQRAQPGDQFLRLERLGKVVIGSGVEACHLVRPRIARGENKNGEVAPFLAPHAEDGKAVDLRQAKVEDHGIVILGRAKKMSVLTIGREIDRIAGLLARRFELLPEGWL